MGVDFFLPNSLCREYEMWDFKRVPSDHRSLQSGPRMQRPNQTPPHTVSSHPRRHRHLPTYALAPRPRRRRRRRPRVSLPRRRGTARMDCCRRVNPFRACSPLRGLGYLMLAFVAAIVAVSYYAVVVYTWGPLLLGGGGAAAGAAAVLVAFHLLVSAARHPLPPPYLSPSGCLFLVLYAARGICDMWR